MQQYLVMKNVVAHAMTLNQEQVVCGRIEAKENTKEKDPVKAKLLRDIATMKIQTYRNNLVLERIEQTLQDMKRSKILGSSAKAPGPVISSDKD